MANRQMPSVMWHRGNEIVAKGLVAIDFIDRQHQRIEATVQGHEAYDVVVALNLADSSCTCAFFPSHGYCKHIAAVEVYFRSLGQSLEGVLTGQKPQPAATQSSGARLLEQLAVPTRRYFHGLPEAAAPGLTLEATLSLMAYRGQDYGYQPRFVMKLRLGEAGSGKFYVVRNLPQFLAAYAEGAEFHTGGQAHFALASAHFSDSEVALLAFLGTCEPVDQYRTRDYDSGYRRYALLGPGDVARLQATWAQLPHFVYSTSDGRDYPALHLTPFTPKSGVFAARVTAAPGGYTLSFTQTGATLVASERLLVRDDQAFELTMAQVAQIEQLLPVMSESLQFNTDEPARLQAFLDYFGKVGQVAAPALQTPQPATAHFALAREEDAVSLTLSFVPADAAPAQVAQAADYLMGLGFHRHAGEWLWAFADPATLFRFFDVVLPNLKQNGTVTMDPALADLLQTAPQPAVAVSQKDGLLAINFSLAGIAPEAVDAMLEQLDVARPYLVRPDGGLMLVDARLKRVATGLRRVRQAGKWHRGQLEVATTQALAVQAALGEAATFDQQFTQLVADLAHPEQFQVPDQQPVQATLRPYQRRGVQWLEMLDAHGFGGILADEMGLGKTLQVIAFLNNHKDASRPSLVVAPASLLYNWLAECEKFAPDLQAVVVDGSKAERVATLAASAQLWITSYNLLRRDWQDYQNVGYLILDEAQFVKNSGAKTHQALAKLHPKNTFALSGTPVENRATELWSLFALVVPGLLPNKKAFKHLAPEDVAMRVRPFILRRSKAAVLQDLPPQIETNLTNDMPKAQKTVYLAQLQQMQVQIRGLSSSEFVKNKLAILAGLTRLRQICDTPALYLDDYHGGSGKLDQLADLLQEAADSGRHVLIFSQFTKMLAQIEGLLQAAGLPCFVLQGSTPSKQRLAMVDAFNHGEKSFFLISLKAGGTGLNLTGADLVILVDLWWNPAVEDQAIARAHRIGQKHAVDVYRLITKGTIEEQIVRLQAKKRALVDALLSGTQNRGSLSDAELKEILGIDD